MSLKVSEMYDAGTPSIRAARVVIRSNLRWNIVAYMLLLSEKSSFIPHGTSTLNSCDWDWLPLKKRFQFPRNSRGYARTGVGNAAYFASVCEEACIRLISFANDKMRFTRIYNERLDYSHFLRRSFGKRLRHGDNRLIKTVCNAQVVPILYSKSGLRMYNTREITKAKTKRFFNHHSHE